MTSVKCWVWDPLSLLSLSQLRNVLLSAFQSSLNPDVICDCPQTAAAATKETTCWVTPLPPPSACVAITKQCDDLVVWIRWRSGWTEGGENEI